MEIGDNSWKAVGSHLRNAERGEKHWGFPIAISYLLGWSKHIKQLGADARDAENAEFVPKLVDVAKSILSTSQSPETKEKARAILENIKASSICTPEMRESIDGALKSAQETLQRKPAVKLKVR